MFCKLIATVAAIVFISASAGDALASGTAVEPPSPDAVARDEVQSTGSDLFSLAPIRAAVLRLPLGRALVATMRAPSKRPQVIGSGGRVRHGSGQLVRRQRELRGRPSGVDYVVSERVSVGLRYRYATRESLGLDSAQTGLLESGFDSHRLLVQARWSF